MNIPVSWKEADLQVVQRVLERISSDTSVGYHKIPVANANALQVFLAKKRGKVLVAEYCKGVEVVNDGVLTACDIDSNPDLQYAHVPLGVVLRGNIVVLKAGKGTKTLGPGDFIGLFETSDWLLTKRSRQIGEWTLIADTECDVMYFGSSLLQEETAQASEFRNYFIALARADHVPQPISSLPLLDWAADHTTRSRLPDCAIIVHTHLLPNSSPFFRHLSHLVAPGRIYILEKPYSTIRSVFNDLVRSGYDVTKVHMEAGMPYEFATQKSIEVLWRKVIESQKKYRFKKLLIVDDGGDLWHSIPWKELEGVQIVGVEQTQRGITRVEGSTIKTPPIISVASSGIKKLIESEFIGISVVKKLNELGAISDSKQIGILGVGSIGGAVQRALTAMGRTVLCYDPTYHSSDSVPENSISSIDVLLNKCDLIVGTVGTDSIVGTALERVSGSKVLVSASSADVEFGSLLKLAEPTSDVYGTQIVTVHDDLDLKILNGGYPINFDRIKDSTPDEDIVLTRCLLYIGAMQAAHLLSIGEQTPGIYDLDKMSQKHLLERWVEYKKELAQMHHVKEEHMVSIVAHSSLQNAKETPTVWED
ncbi:MAG: Adenosylhomocysteinase [Parcubacteria bacterium C7867-008]|nr:MAG: Adenosylhomocysteinase [Parcubacteria bacterium C7867-008]